MIHTEGDPIAEEGDYSIAILRQQDFLPIAQCPTFAIVCLQVGLALNRDVDRPRNLAKSVTVDKWCIYSLCYRL